MGLRDGFVGDVVRVGEAAGDLLDAVGDAMPDGDRPPRPELEWTTVDRGRGGVIKKTERAIDAEAGVVLYRFQGSDRGGLAAVPIDQTDLDAPSDDGETRIDVEDDDD